MRVPEDFHELERTEVANYIRELAVQEFTREVLATSTLTGAYGVGGSGVGEPKEQLDEAKVAAIIGMELQ